MAGESHAFKLLLEQLTGRLDSHGDDIRDMRDKLDCKLDKVFNLLKDCQVRDCATHEAFSTRLTKIETSRSSIGTTMNFVYLGAISLVSAVLGGIITRVTL